MLIAEEDITREGHPVIVRKTVVHSKTILLSKKAKWINPPSRLLRQLSHNFKTKFYTSTVFRTVFRQPLPLPEGALKCRWPTADCIVYLRMGGVTGDNLHRLRFALSSR